MKKGLLFFLFAAFFVSNAWGTPRYEADVSVDVTAKTVVEAKKQAMNKAVRDGINEVVSNISTKQSVDAINKLTDVQLQHFLQGVMVLMEKSSDVRYIADLRISVNEDVLRAYMKENNMPFVVSEKQEVLLIPLFEREDGLLDLWGDDNIWRMAFVYKKDIKKGNLNINSIEKNLGNITSIDVNTIYDMTNAQYEDLSSFNGVNDIYVLKYSNKDGKIYIKHFPEIFEETVLIEDKTTDVLVDEVIKTFRDFKKEKNVTEDTNALEEIQSDVVYHFSKLSEWAVLKKFLLEEPLVLDVELVSMTSGKVHFILKYRGMMEKIRARLALKGYKVQQEGEHYAIY